MSTGVYRLLTLMIAVCSLTACLEEVDVKSDQDKTTNEKNTLDLGGFTVIREKQAGGDIRYEDFNNRAFEVGIDSLLLSDKLYYNIETDENIRLISTVSCGSDLRIANNQLVGIEYTQDRDLAFDRPIEILELIPEGILFRPQDPSNDGLKCHFKFYAENEVGSTRHPVHSPDPSRGETHPGNLKRVFASSENRLVESLVLAKGTRAISDDDAVIYQDEVDDLLLWSHRLQYQDTSFNKLKMVCETFDLEQELQSNYKQTSLQDFDFNRARIRETYKFTRHDTFVSQVCRLLAYKDQRLIGVTSYFKLKQDQKYPDVNLSYTGSAYSDGDRKADGFKMTTFATLNVSNPHQTPLAVEVDLSSFETSAQFISSSIHTREINGDGPPNLTAQEYRAEKAHEDQANKNWSFFREHRSVIYQVFPYVELNGPNLAVKGNIYPTTDTGEAKDLKTELEVTAPGSSGPSTENYNQENPPRFQVILEPGEQMSVNLRFNDEKSRCWFYNKRGIGKNSPVGARGTYGVILQSKMPRIELLELAPSSVDNFGKIENYRHAGPAVEQNTLLEPHLMYSTSNNSRGWRQRYEYPESRLVIQEAPIRGQLNFYNVCREQTYFQTPSTGN